VKILGHTLAALACRAVAAMDFPELATYEETLKQGKRKSTYRYLWIHDIPLGGYHIEHNF
jgi:hypothetical protein